MNRIVAWFGCLVLFSSMASAQSVEELNGDWTVTSGTLAGQNVPSSSLESMSLKFASNTFDAKSGSLTSGGIVALAQEGTFQLNFTINRGADAGKTVRALYRLADGVLTITYSQDETYPANHSSTAANKYCMLMYRRGGRVAADETVIMQGDGAAQGAAASFAK